MSAAHTPGPWILDPVAGAAGSSYVYSEPDSSALIARVDARECGDEQAKANAKLIAAAPDMLAALQNILHVETTAKGCSDIRWDAVHAAIAKATKS